MKRVRQRTHENTEIHPSPAARYRWWSDGVLQDDTVVDWYTNYLPIALRQDSEFMEDEIGPRPSPSSPRAVTHWRRIIERASPSGNQTSTSVGQSPTIVSSVDMPGMPWFSIGVGHEFTISDIMTESPRLDESLYREAEARFLDSNAVDTVLNAIEAPSLYSSAQSLYKTGRISHGRLPKLGRRLRTLGDLVAGGYLSYQFGVAPLISDMTKLHQQVGSVKDQIARAARLAEKPIRVSSWCPLTIGFKDLTHPGVPWPIKQTTNWTSTFKPVKVPTRRCVISGRYPRVLGSDTAKKLEYYFNKYGGPGPVNLVWELIPFSFVVDWFVDTSSILNHMENALRPNPRVVDSVTFSTSWELDIRSTYHSVGSWVNPSNGKEMIRQRLRYYHRVPGTYHISHRNLSSDRFGKKQLALSAALLWSIARSLANRIY